MAAGAPRRPAELYAASLAGSGGLYGRRRGAEGWGWNGVGLAPLAGAEARIAAIEDPVQRLGVEGSLPAWLAERLVAELGIEEARAFAAAVNVRAPSPCGRTSSRPRATS